jgi:hypothetical protein
MRGTFSIPPGMSAFEVTTQKSQTWVKSYWHPFNAPALPVNN